MTAREPANVDDARAQAAERLLERKRMGLESAVEALEAVCYRVIRREDGSYAVRPPYVCSTTRDDVEAGKIQTRPSDYLADYPVMQSTIPRDRCRCGRSTSCVAPRSSVGDGTTSRLQAHLVHHAYLLGFLRHVLSEFPQLVATSILAPACILLLHGDLTTVHGTSNAHTYRPLESRCLKLGAVVSTPTIRHPPASG